MIDQDIVKLNTEVRKNSGTGIARALRRNNKIPAVIYGKGRETVSLSLCNKEFMARYRVGALSTHLIEMNIDNKIEFALMREIQRHPVTDLIEHVDFQFVDKNLEIKVDVPVSFLNENSCIGIKRGGVLNILHNTLPIKCFPGAIPQNIEIDLANLTIGHSIHINDLTLPEGVKINFKEENAALVTISNADSEIVVNQESDSSAIPENN